MSLITFAIDTTQTGGRGTPNAISPGSDSNNWTHIAGTQTASFASNQIVLTYVADTNFAVWTYSGQSSTDQEALVNVTQANQNYEVAGAVLRCADANHYYYADIGNSSGNLEIGKCVGGSQTSLAVAAASTTAGTKYSIRFQSIGAVLKAKIWDAGISEPAAWTVQVTDSTLSSGGFGIMGAPAGASTCMFDTFSATNGFFVSPNPVMPAVGAEQLGLVAAATNADLVPAQDIGTYRSWSLQVDAVATGGTLTFQGSNDGTNYATVYGYKAVDGTLVSTATATGIYYGSRNYRYLRVRQTAWTSGATTGTLELYVQ